MTVLDNWFSTQLPDNKIIIAITTVASLGFIDALYLTTRHYVGTINCSVVYGCQAVLDSSYSTIFGIPTALLGALYYLFILLVALYYIDQKSKLALKALALVPTLGFIFSLWLVYLQIYVIDAICIYCMASALTSTLLFILSVVLFRKRFNKLNEQKND